LELLGLKVFKVPQARLAQPEFKVFKVALEPPEFKVLMERLELLVCRVFKASKEYKVLQDQLVLPASERLDRLGLLALEHRGQRELLALLVLVEEEQQEQERMLSFGRMVKL
jgi:hypothetical protein